MTRPMIRWWKNGDHPLDHSTPLDQDAINAAVREGVFLTSFLTEGKVVGFFTHPTEAKEAIDVVCGQPWMAHGSITIGGEEVVVHPGDLVSETGAGGYVVEHPDVLANAKAYLEEAGVEVPAEARGVNPDGSLGETIA